MNLLFIRTSGGYSGAEKYNEYLFEGIKKYTDTSCSMITNSRLLYEKLKDVSESRKLICFPFPEIGTKKTLLISLLFLPWIYISYARLIYSPIKTIIILESMTEKLFLTTLLKLLHYRVVWIEHGPLFITNRAKVVKWLYCYIAKFTDKIIVVSKDTKRDLIKGGVEKEKVKIVYIGIFRKSDSGNSKINSRNLYHKPSVLGFVGTVCKEKGIAEFIDTASILIKDSPKIKFLVIGDGPKLEWAKQKVIDIKLTNNFEFTGFVSDVSPYLSKIDILFSPTKHHEGLSLSLLEALSAGCLVVARDIGGNKEIIKNKITGYLYKKDEEAITILEKVLCNSIKIVKIRKNGQAFVRKNFSSEKQTKEFVKIASS